MKSIVSLLVILLCTTASLQGAAAGSGGFLSAHVCGECHKETYKSWSRTFHALAAIDPVFTEALERAKARWGEEAGRTCLTCHSPTTVRSGDFGLAGALSREGVTCSFCHSVTSVDRSRSGSPFTNEPSLLVIDENTEHIKDHHFESHALTMSSEFCAGCHEWTNSRGLKVLSTFSEWKESYYAGEQVSCQQCHMPKSLGSETMAAGKKGLHSTNLHFQVGGHSQDQLVAAAQMTAAAAVEEGRLRVEAEVTNLKAGHKLPTGIPTRKLKLRVDLFDGEGLVLESRERVYSRVIADEEGKVLTDVTEQFILGALEVSDNRIAPKEKRSETFLFPRPAGQDFVLVEVSLVYEIFTPYLNPSVLTFDITRKRIPVSFDARKDPSSTTLPLAIIGVVFLAVTAIMIVLFVRGNAPREDPERKE